MKSSSPYCNIRVKELTSSIGEYAHDVLKASGRALVKDMKKRTGKATTTRGKAYDELVAAKAIWSKASKAPADKSYKPHVSATTSFSWRFGKTSGAIPSYYIRAGYTLDAVGNWNAENAEKTTIEKSTVDKWQRKTARYRLNRAYKQEKSVPVSLQDSLFGSGVARIALIKVQGRDGKTRLTWTRKGEMSPRQQMNAQRLFREVGATSRAPYKRTAYKLFCDVLEAYNGKSLHDILAATKVKGQTLADKWGK